MSAAGALLIVGALSASAEPAPTPDNGSRSANGTTLIRQTLAGSALTGPLLTVSGWAGNGSATLPTSATPGRRDHVRTIWGIRQGAPADIAQIAEAADGSLWLASAQGLVRFDGRRFERINLFPDGSSQPQNLSAVLMLRDQSVWAAFRGGGAAVFRPSTGAITRYGAAEGLPGVRLATLSAFDDEIWGTSLQGLYRFKDGRWTEVSRSVGLPVSTARAMRDRDGGLFVQAEADRAWWHVPAVDGHAALAPALGHGASAFQDVDGRFWLWRDADQLALTDADGHEQRRWHISRPAAGPMVVDRRGDLWSLGWQGSIFRISNPQAAPTGEAPLVEEFAISKGLEGAIPLTVIEDRNGQIWIGTTSGLVRFAVPLVHRLVSQRGRGGGSLVADGTGVWAAQSSEPLTRYEASGARQFVPLPEGTTDKVGSTLLRDRQGTLWVGGFEALWRVQGDRMVPVPTPDDARLRFVQALADAPDGSLWMSISDRGLWHRQGTVWTAAKDPSLQGTCLVMTDLRGGIAAGFADGRVVMVDGAGHATPLEGQGLPKGRILALHERGDHLWIGGDGGVSLWVNGQAVPVVLTSSDHVGMVTGIVETPGGDVWLNETDGLLYLPRSEVQRLNRPGGGPVQALRLGTYDGLYGTLHPFRKFPSLAQDAHGMIWASRGLLTFWIDPTDLNQDILPPVPAIVSVRSERGPLPAGPAITLGQGDRLQLGFSASDLVRAEALRYRARLVGWDPDWRELGTTSEVSYSSLPPGHYEFQLQAAGLRQRWNERETASLKVEVPPAWYQTWTAKLAAALVLVGLATLLFRYRVRWAVGQAQRQIRDRLSAQVNERERIARELHDNLLQSTIGMALQVQASVKRLSPQDPARARLEKALAEVEQVVEDTRSQVLDLRDELQTRSLGAAIFEALSVSGRADGTRLEVTETGSLRTLAPGVGRELKSIALEALHNAIQHAQAQHIQLIVMHDAAHLRLLVKDDGVGLPPAALRDKQVPGHFGLIGMRERATLLGAELRWVSSAGQGTTVELTLRAARAYVVQDDVDAPA